MVSAEAHHQIPPDLSATMPELVRCPACSKKLRVPDRLVGRNVKCPSCGTTFTANAEMPVESPEEIEPTKPSPRRRRDDESISERPRHRRSEDLDDEDRPRRRSRRDSEEEDEEEYEEETRPRKRGRRRQAALDAVTTPAIALLVVGILGILLGIANILVVAAGFGVDPRQQAPPGFTAGRYVGAFVSLIWGIVVTLGAVKLKTLQSRGSAMTGVVFSLLPCSPCCLAGLPLGIWALVVMNKPEVKDAFQ